MTIVPFFASRFALLPSIRTALCRMQTERGKPIEEVNGYLMVPHNVHKDTQYWRCLFYDKHDCKARGSSDVGSRVILMTKDHNGHLPDPAIAAVSASALVLLLKNDIRAV